MTENQKLLDMAAAISAGNKRARAETSAKIAVRLQEAEKEILKLELGADVELLDELEEKNRQAVARVSAGAEDELDYAALGYTIHNLYCLFENYFLRIAKFFENSLDAAAWHRDLVDRMVLEIENLRPALLDRQLARGMHELRSFRHKFRNIYDGGLDAEKLALLQKRLPAWLAGFRTAHERFCSKLRTIRDNLS